MAKPRKRGNSYRFEICYGLDKDGKPKRYSESWTPPANMTAKQIEKELMFRQVDFENRVKNSQVVDGRKITLHDFFNDFYLPYIKELVNQGKKSKGYLDSLKNSYELHILPEIGYKKLTEITALEVTKLIKIWQDKPVIYTKKDTITGAVIETQKKRSEASVLTQYNALRSCLAYASDVLEIISKNPCTKRITPTKTKSNETKGLTVAQTHLLLDILDKGFTVTNKRDGFKMKGGKFKLDKNGEKIPYKQQVRHFAYPLQLKVFVCLALVTGARRGGILNLKWQDIDFDNSTVNIYEEKTKTYNRLALPNEIMPLLIQHREEQNQIKLIMGDRWENTGDWLFIQNEHGIYNGKQMYKSTPTNEFKKIIKRYNSTAPDGEKLPDITLHGLRHTTGTFLRRIKNLDDKRVADQLSHSNPNTTRAFYFDPMDDVDTEIGEMVGQLVFRSSGLNKTDGVKMA